MSEQIARARANEQLAGLFDLTGQVAAVTGGGGVLCGTMAKALAMAGARVAVLDLFPEPAQRVADEIVATGAEAIPVQVDVLDKASIAAAAATVADTLGPVDILVNGAGGNKPQATTSATQTFFDLPEDAFQWVFNLNFIGSLLPGQVFGRGMVDRGRGSIVNISSMNAFRPLTNIAAYSAAKAAISNFTQWLAVHLAQNYTKGIRVNAIAPGFFITNQNRFLLYDEATGNLTPRGQKVIDHTPLGRFGEPDDLTSTLLWLLSPASSFVNGIVVPVDGGFSAYSGV